MGFIIGILLGIIITLLWLKYSTMQYYKTNLNIKELTIRTLSFDDSLEHVNEIKKQISRHKELGCSSYVFVVPFELAYTEVFHQFISEYDYKCQVTNGESYFKFQIEL